MNDLNVILIEKPYSGVIQKLHPTYPTTGLSDSVSYHLYITEPSKLKINDWVHNTVENNIFQLKNDEDLNIGIVNKYPKVIATTDILNDGNKMIPKISSSSSNKIIAELNNKNQLKIFSYNIIDDEYYQKYGIEIVDVKLYSDINYKYKEVIYLLNKFKKDNCNSISFSENQFEDWCNKNLF